MNRFEDLSERQSECLRLLGRGLNAKQIAGELDLSYETVNAHLKAARRILGVGRSLDAARLLLEAKRDGGESVGTHPMVIAPHDLRPPGTSHQGVPVGFTTDQGQSELREARMPFFVDDRVRTDPQVGRRRFDDITPARRMLIILVAMMGCVVTVAGLAAIAGSLQTILWSVTSEH